MDRFGLSMRVSGGATARRHDPGMSRSGAQGWRFSYGLFRTSSGSHPSVWAAADMRAVRSAPSVTIPFAPVKRDRCNRPLLIFHPFCYFSAMACLSVSQLNELARVSLQSCFEPEIWVQGEIQGLKLHAKSGHLYFDLVEKGRGPWTGTLQRSAARSSAVPIPSGVPCSHPWG
jgi:hypothetical protein